MFAVWKARNFANEPFRPWVPDYRLQQDVAVRHKRIADGPCNKDAPASQSPAGEREAGASSASETSTQEPCPQRFWCAICFDEHDMEESFIASSCGHMMCRDAARGVVLTALKSCSFPCPCPICQARLEPRCAACAQRTASLAEEGPGRQDAGTAAWCCNLDADAGLLLSEDEQRRYLACSLKAAVNRSADLVPCPQPDCAGMAAGGADGMPRVFCNLCYHSWCKACRVPWHAGATCEQQQRRAQGNRALEEFPLECTSPARIVRCPGPCGHGIQKISGCNKVQCSQCKTCVCWLCGLKLCSDNPYDHFRRAGGCPMRGE